MLNTVFIYIYWVLLGFAAPKPYAITISLFAGFLYSLTERIADAIKESQDGR